MKNYILPFLLASVLSVSSAFAVQTISLNTTIDPSVTPPSGVAPWSYITLTEVTRNVIDLKIGSHLTEDEFISMIGLNVDSSIDLNLISFSNSQQSGYFTSPTISVGSNSINGGGGSRFDIGFSFATSNASGGSKRFNENDWISYRVSYSGAGTFTTGSFAALDGSNKLNTIAHVQSIGCDDSSAWITNRLPDKSIPEPSAAIFGSLAAFTLLRRRK